MSARANSPGLGGGCGWAVALSLCVSCHAVHGHAKGRKPLEPAAEWRYLTSEFSAIARGTVKNESLSTRQALAYFGRESTTHLTSAAKKRFATLAKKVRKKNRALVKYPKRFFKKQMGPQRATVRAISKRQVRIWVLNHTGRYRYSGFYDLLGEYTFDRTPEIDRLFDLQALWRRLTFEVRGISIGSPSRLVFEKFEGEEFYERNGPLEDYRDLYFPESRVSVVIHGKVKKISEGEQPSFPIEFSDDQPFHYRRCVADSSNRWGRMTSVAGVAKDAKAGAVVRDQKGRLIHVDGLARWPAEMLNQQVHVVGEFIKLRKGSQNSSVAKRSPGAPSGPKQLVVKQAQWKLLD